MIAVAAGWIGGCGVFGKPAESPGGAAAYPPGQAPPATPARVELRESADRPPMSLVARAGDPFPAIAVAIAHDLGPQASAALAALLEARLEAAGVAGVVAAPHGNGLRVSTLVRDEAAARRFVQATAAALGSPVTENDPALARVTDGLQVLRSRRLNGRPETAVAACSSELGLPPGVEPIDPSTPAGTAAVEGWRRTSFDAGAVAFGALGPKSVLDAAAHALAETSRWPTNAPVTDPWPERDVVGAVAATDGPRELSVALRVAEPSAVIEAAHRLGRRGSALEARLGVFDPPWHIDRVVGSTRMRGACLRIDLAAPASDDAPASRTVASAAVAAVEEARHALSRARSSEWTLEDSVLRANDPREAAAVAAWRALSGRLDPGPDRTFVSYATRADEAKSGVGARVRRDMRRFGGGATNPMATRTRVEEGQGELWLLLASPCGTAPEGVPDAGLLALSVRSMIESAHPASHVTFEPWISPDAVGVLAHGARLDATETPEQHAERIARALGRVLGRPLGPEVARAREQVLEAIGPEPRPGWWLAIETLSPEHPSWLEPRGTWQAVHTATPHEVDTRRRALLSGPLRLGVLANWDEHQARVATGVLDGWLRPARHELQRCPTAALPPARAGLFELETSPEGLGARALVGVRIDASGNASAFSEDLLWTAWLLNRPSGWLDRALRVPDFASRARARLLGGERVAALIVEVDATDDKVDAAVAQVRALLGRLAEGATTTRDLAVAREHFAGLEAAAALDPRRRLVRTWRGDTDRTPTVESLRALHRRTFAAERHVVVVAETSP